MIAKVIVISAGGLEAVTQPNAQGALRDASKALLLLAAIGWG